MRGTPSWRVEGRGFLVAQWIAVAVLVLFAQEAAAATSGYTITSASSIRFTVNDAAWADLHYQINGGGQLNFRMIATGTNHAYDVTGVPSGATVRYFFTIGP